jgi:ectoine hydroxylase-related dioxygenase (phytanoyl-CoA dioxygenase family)
MKLSPEEIASGQLSPETLVSAVNQVKLNGYVLFEEVLPADQVDELNASFLKLLVETMKTNAKATEVNTIAARKNRVRMDLPFQAPYTDPQVITNSFAMPIIKQILGEDCRCFYFSVDAPLPGSDYQQVHGDYMPFFPEAEISLPAAGLVVNFPLVHVTEENGPMEAWPGGTHLTPEKLSIPEHIVPAAEFIKPVRMLMSKGSLLIRDVRMWHRGTPNNSNQIRPNIGLIYAREWWDGEYYPQDSLGITQAAYDELSTAAQKLFRFEKLV